MNYARWSIDQINRQRHRSNHTTKDQTLTTRKSIIDLVLEEKGNKKPQPSNKMLKKVLDMDEAQLDITLNQRGLIYKNQTAKETPRTKENSKIDNL